MSSTERLVQTALTQVRCCHPETVTQLGLIKGVEVKEGAARVKVLPCCVFGLTRLVASVRAGVAGVEGVSEVEVDVDWEQVGTAHQAPRSALVQLDLQTWAAAKGIRPGSAAA